MKSFATSAALHAIVITWGLWTFSVPRPLDMTQGEALPVELVPYTDVSEAVQAEEDAPLADTPMPTPTQAPERTPMPAENIGENEVDLESPPQPENAPREVQQTATEAPPPPPAEEAPPEPEVEETPPPAQQAEPAPEPTPEPVEQAEAEPEPTPEPPAPQNVPVPQIRPTPPKPVEQPRTQVAENKPRPEPTPETPEKEFNTDEIAALLNKEQSAGGGAKRSEQEASLGTKKTTGKKLSQRELDGLKAKIQRCWSPPSGTLDAGELRVTIEIRLDPSGSIIGMPKIVGGGSGSMSARVAGEAAIRAIRLCAPYDLPSETYESWSFIHFTFDPKEMF